MSKNERYHLSEPLTTHSSILAKLMISGGHLGKQMLPSLPMHKPIEYNGVAYRYIKLGRLLSLEPDGGRDGDLLHFSPVMNIHVHPEPGSMQGLITDISYAHFGLSSAFFEKGTDDEDQQIRKEFLIPEGFDIALGNYVEADEETLVSNGVFKTADEYGEAAQAAGESIVAAATVLTDYTIQDLRALYEH